MIPHAIQREHSQYEKATDLLSRIEDFQLPMGRNGIPNVATIQPQIQVSMLKGYGVTRVPLRGFKGATKPIEECDRAQLFSTLRRAISEAREVVRKVNAYYAALDAQMLEEFAPEQETPTYPFFPEGIPAQAKIMSEVRYRDYELDPGVNC